jgi:hopene-associated glycosyltransferase HpnB
MTLLLTAALGCAIWAYLLVARGGFWRNIPPADAAMPPAPHDAPWPRVIAVIPARDEAALIGQTVGSLLRQEYRGSFALIVVDDHSTDGTAAAARQAAVASGQSDRLTVLAAPSLPDGWTGKLWAVNHGVVQAQAGSDPVDYLLLTDADITFAADTLTSLVRRCVADRLVLNSLMAKLRCQSLVERAFIPPFIFFFKMLYPFAWVNRPDRHTAAAAGGCMLVQRATLQAAGGIEAIRGELIDDCALARLLKGHGAIRLALTEGVRSSRANSSLADIRNMVARSAYAQLRFSPWLLAGTTVGMTVTFLMPPALAFLAGGAPQWLGLLAWAFMALALQPLLRFYAVAPTWGLAMPLIAAMYVAFTLDSAYAHWRGRGGAWKGRTYRAGSARAAPGQGR